MEKRGINMDLVIKIPEELKNKIDNANEDNYRTYLWWFETTLYCAIKDGIPLEEELEKIKEKINSEDIDCQYEEDYVYSSGLQKAIELIDDRIEELKGE